MSKFTTLKKPNLGTVRAFAEGATAKAHKTQDTKSGQIPAGDVRLTANLRGDLHLRLKIKAAERRTTVGELIEEWIESWK